MSTPAPSGQPLTFQKDDELYHVLLRLVGVRVDLWLASGEKMTGTIISVGDTVIHVAQIAGQEFYDAIVVINQITAVAARVR